jgi:Ca-activated chloride channel family protein
MLADQKQTAHLRVGLTGFELEEGDGRAPVNVAIVLDKSGSMSGEKIQKAKEAAIMALRRLNSKDIVSVVVYDDTVRVVVPATKLLDRAAIEREIRRINAGGSTALFAGVSKGAAEVRKFLSRDRVNRIILLSDGLANVGPSSPAELGDLGASFAKDGISVTAIGLGLGYNEDLMTRIAMRSDGMHHFAEEARDLARLFKTEFGTALSVVAQEVAIKVRCARGIRPVRVLRGEADISGQNVVILMNQIYSGEEKRVVLEVEVPPTSAGKSREIASVDVSYANMQTKTTDRLTSSVEVTFTESKKVVQENVDPTAMAVIVRQQAAVTYRTAMRLRDEGKKQEAQALFESNAVYLETQADLFDSDNLRQDSISNFRASRNLSDEDWIRERKQSTFEADWSMY